MILNIEQIFQWPHDLSFDSKSFRTESVDRNRFESIVFSIIIKHRLSAKKCISIDYTLSYNKWFVRLFHICSVRDSKCEIITTIIDIHCISLLVIECYKKALFLNLVDNDINYYYTTLVIILSNCDLILELNYFNILRIFCDKLILA